MTKTIVIQGLGEIGASIATVLAKQPDNYVIGVDIDATTLEYAMQQHIVTETNRDLAAVAQRADIIILATPVKHIEQSMQALAQMALKPNVIITDAGSTKREIMAIAEAYLVPKQIAFIGGHAMVGTHLSGVQNVNPNLHSNAPYFLMPASNIGAQLPELQAVLQPLGAKFVELEVMQHDALMAVISDLPHIVAYALMNTATQELGATAEFGQYVAGGFIDTTRIAASDPTMWTDIILSNQQAILASLQALSSQLDTFTKAIENNAADELSQLITTAQGAREQLLRKREDHV
ncbi:MAG: prephenate dehydrogenase/arogenate dehydrogenase family protein [Lactobacillaceae bacterium]|jgi:prephenate dehydrogenase|nr:prephenate dehydrogenase/arogenate dehydrogenase family protein [Lactobacillaceae bacterium]